MIAVILAGGLGTRLSEETNLKPKPMIEIGGKPILWHIMKMYSHHGVNEFIICCGYKGYQIKTYFANYFLQMSDVTFDLNKNRMDVHQERSEPWKVTIVDTGDITMTGGRLRRVADYLKNEEMFCLTYGDGVGDNDIAASIAFHRSHGKAATLTAAYPPARFGVLDIQQLQVKTFKEKPQDVDSFINAGFFVLSPKVLTYLNNDDTIWERDPLTQLAKDGELMAYQHYGFWQPMDTLHDKNILEKMWESGSAPWKKWD